MAQRKPAKVGGLRTHLRRSGRNDLAGKPSRMDSRTAGSGQGQSADARLRRNLFRLGDRRPRLDFLADGGSDTAINMVVNGVTVATTTVETPRLIKIAYTGK